MSVSLEEMIGVFKALGCEDVRKCAIAAMVCQDLRESCKYSKIEDVFDSVLNLLYFRCYQEDGKVEIIIPHNSCQKLNFLEVEKLQRGIGVNGMRVTIASCEPNSGILYYTLHNGFKEK